MTNEYRIRLATADDLPRLVAFRSAMFRDMGWTDESVLADLEGRYAEYVRDAIARGDFVAWLVDTLPAEKTAPACAIAGAALLWERVPPTVRNLSGLQAYILAVYVEPEFRRRGIARALLENATAHAREHGADVVSLHYSPAGKELYEQLGFAVSPEMRLFLRPDAAAWSPGAPAHVPADDAD